MEAWLQETPVLVHHTCQVTLEHCLAAQGGLYFRDNFEFMEVLDFLLANPNLARHMGLKGKRYVEANYDWHQLIGRLVDTLTAWRVG